MDYKQLLKASDQLLLDHLSMRDDALAALAKEVADNGIDMYAPNSRLDNMPKLIRVVEHWDWNPGNAANSCARWVAKDCTQYLPSQLFGSFNECLIASIVSKEEAQKKIACDIGKLKQELYGNKKKGT